MALSIYSKAIIRIPRFSYQDDFESNWNELKNMIRDSSPDFYAVIKEMSLEELKESDLRCQQTVWKYFNRARYRATPFGTFASSAIIELSDNQKADLVFNSHQLVHEFADWSQVPGRSDIPIQEQLLVANSSFYTVGNEIRFIQRIEESFEIATVAYDPLLIEILNSCIEPKHYDVLIMHLQSSLSVPPEIDEILVDMLELQLLLSSVNANIIGEDYFSRLGISAQPDALKYKIAESRVEQHIIDQSIFRFLPALASLLNQTSAQEPPSNLRDFADRYFQKFEQAEIPLMVALDPEVGVGYGFMEQESAGKKDHIKAFIGTSNERENTDQRKDWLLSKLSREFSTQEEIRLDDIPLLTDQESKLPNTFNAICRVVDGLVWLEYMGGATANSLMGRFTLALPEVEQIGKEMVTIEEQANPDVIFFDIAYTSEINVDNINRRKQIYNMQVNILNFGGSIPSQPISDLYLCVKKGKVILYSKTLNKRVVPKMASAYNYRRSSLPLFRMLCDLQYQDTTGDLMFRSQSVLPDKDFYPRILYRNIVVSPASWRISWKVLANQKDQLSVLKQKLADLSVPRFIRSGTADQTLLFDITSDFDLEILCGLVRKQKELYVGESPLPAISSVKDCADKPYVAEYVVNLFHNQQIFGPFSPSINNGERFKQWIAPGKEWLYFEIYCNHYRADAILSEKITQYLRLVGEYIYSWFFIRYSEGGEHIRLRLRLRTPQYTNHLLATLCGMLEQELQAGSVSDIRICTYKKEVHRYGIENMARVEKHFYLDSEFVLSTIGLNCSDFDKYRICQDMLLAVLKSTVIEYKAFTSMVDKVFGSLAREHHLKPEQYKSLNLMHVEFREHSLVKFEDSIAERYALMQHSLIETISRCSQKSAAIILADLMHMHVNRIFNSDQRTHEMILFYFVQKELNRQQFSVPGIRSF